MTFYPFFVLVFLFGHAFRSEAVFDVMWNSSMIHPMGNASFGGISSLTAEDLAQNEGGCPLLALRESGEVISFWALSLYCWNGTWNVFYSVAIDRNTSSIGIIKNETTYGVYARDQDSNSRSFWVNQSTTGWDSAGLPESKFAWDSSYLYAFATSQDNTSLIPMGPPYTQLSHAGQFASCVVSTGQSVVQLCSEGGTAAPLVFRTLPDFEEHTTDLPDLLSQIVCSWHQIVADDLIMYLLRNGSVMLTQVGQTTHFMSSHTFVEVIDQFEAYCFSNDNKYWIIYPDANGTYDRMTYFTLFDASPATSASRSMGPTEFHTSIPPSTQPLTSTAVTIQWTFTWSSEPDPITACLTWLMAICLIPLQPTIYGNVALNSTVAKVTSQSDVTIRGDMTLSRDAGIIYYVSHVNGVWISGIVNVDGSVNANGNIDIQISGEISDRQNFEIDLISFKDFSGNFTVTAGTSKEDLKAVGYVQDNKYRARIDFAASDQVTQSAALKTPVIIGIVVGIVGLFVVISVLVVILVVKQKRKVQNSDVELKSATLTGVSVGRSIGKGAFGEVYLGTWSGNQVALKKMQADNIDDFVSEASTLSRVTHPNVVQYFGTAIIDECQFLVMEYMSGKSLHTLVSTKDLELEQLLDLSFQCAAGMMHLAEKQIVHRDLALRNVLIAPTGTGYVAKIADFGMSRLTANGDYSAKGGVLPIRWCSPEVIEHNRFSTASDVWAFGVMMWELFSNAKLPYAGRSNDEVVRDVLSGSVMTPPESAPTSIRQLMTKMWSERPSDRPTFAEISKVIESQMAVPNVQTTIISDGTEEFYSL